ncbi:hypothetical protein QEG73_12865 [Chitinophagaceae bacterium 26-R-25]|nr:hypothetical protein [Chitinophagaceae bacterium 26-R-25]
MSNGPSLTFPNLVLFADYDGNFENYFHAVYEVFEQDFIKSSPYFNKQKVSAQKHPEVDGIHRTFYHITHEGEDEKSRTPDIRRMERIRFPKFCITSCPHDDLLVWKNKRGKDTRVLIFNEDQEYLIVLTERNGYYLFWTAYLVEQSHTKRKLIKEYQDFIKTKTA